MWFRKKKNKNKSKEDSSETNDISKSFWGKTSLITTLVISIVSFGISGYLGINEIFKSPKLNTVINLTYLMPFAEHQKSDILNLMFQDDIKSDSMSRGAIDALKSINWYFPEIITILKKTSSIAFKNMIGNRIAKLELDTTFSYIPTDDLILKYLGHKGLPVSFYIPLNITNTGNQVGTLTNLYLEMKSKTDTTKKWFFFSYFEMNLENVKSLELLKYGNYIGNLNTGYSILPNSSLTINPVFVLNNPKTYSQNIKPGEYLIKFFAYSDKSELIVETHEQLYTITNDNMINVFRNGKTSNWIYNSEEQLKDYIENH